MATTVANSNVAAPGERLLRILEKALEGLTPEQCEAKWEALKNAVTA